MSKAKMQAAKELIQEKQYDEARRILATVDHPTAREWEKKLDRLAPLQEPQQFKSPSSNKQRRGCSRRFYITLLVLAAILIIAIIGRNPPAPQETGQALSVSTHTPGASPTITDTLIASLTPTVIPTATPIMGTRGNAYPLGEMGAIRDGRFRVNSITRNATSIVKAANMFNQDPASGEEWVLVNVTFACDLASDKTCNVSLMRLELVGDLGTVYSSEFVVLSNQFSGEVFGDGQKTGDIGFLVQQNDTNLLVSINDLGERTFFRTQ